MFFFDNTNLFIRIYYRLKSQGKLFYTAFFKKGVPLKELLITRFPYLYKDYYKPPSMHIEFTDACNLRCVYCNNPFFPKPRKYMSQEVFEKTMQEIYENEISRVCVGGGEATIHPHFIDWSNKLSKVTKVFTIVTNGNWTDNEVANAILKNYTMVEISIDAGGEKQYNSSRVGGDYDRLIMNLTYLKEAKKRLNSTTQLNIRLMVRPSNRHMMKEEYSFYKKYSDTIMPEFIVGLEDYKYADDVFITPQPHYNTYPKCTLPFRNFQVRLDGSLSLCQVAGSRLNDRKIIVGNILDSSLIELWQCDTMKQYRNALRFKQYTNMPACKGCRGS